MVLYRAMHSFFVRVLTMAAICVQRSGAVLDTLCSANSKRCCSVTLKGTSDSDDEDGEAAEAAVEVSDEAVAAAGEDGLRAEDDEADGDGETGRSGEGDAVTRTAAGGGDADDEAAAAAATGADSSAAVAFDGGPDPSGPCVRSSARARAITSERSRGRTATAFTKSVI